MAKKVASVGLLPDGRAIRVLKMDSEKMLDMMERIGSALPPVKPGEQAVVDGTVQAKIAKATQRATVAMCVTGITRSPIKLTMKMRPPTAAELEEAKGADAPAPTEIETVDLDASLTPLLDPADARWTALGEQQLENSEDDLYMHKLFDEPAAWKAVIQRISSAGGGSIIDPFAGKLLRTSSG